MNSPGVRVVAVCDVHSGHMARMRQMAGGEKVRTYHDYRKLLEDKDVNVVIVATNAHWHVLCTIAACQAGKDVYVEKPLGNFIGEGRFAIDAARKYDRIVQIGTQQHSREHYRKAVEIIQSGKLGDISEVKVWDYENWFPGRGSPPDCDPPKELDWDFYVGPSPMMPYNPNCYYNYGYDWFKISGAGHQVAWGVHHFDIVHWAMGVQWPQAVSAGGGKFAFPDDNRQWPDTFSAIAEYRSRPGGQEWVRPAVLDADRLPPRAPLARQVLLRHPGHAVDRPRPLYDHRRDAARRQEGDPRRRGPWPATTNTTTPKYFSTTSATTSSRSTTWRSDITPPTSAT